MLRGIWTYAVQVVATVAASVPVVILALLVPRWDKVAMISGKIWSRVMLATVGARVRYDGLQHIPPTTPAIFIANHQSNIDIWALMRVLPLSTRFVAKQELARVPILGWAMAASGFVFIDRRNRQAAIRSLQIAAEKVRGGVTVVLFAEGTRSRDGSLQPFKKGAFHLAIRAGVPVVPVAIRGSFDVMPPGSLRVRPGPVDVTFGEPIDVAPYQPGDHIGLLEAVHSRIAELLQPRPERAAAP